MASHESRAPPSTRPGPPFDEPAHSALAAPSPEAPPPDESTVRLMVEHLPALAWTALPDGHIDYYNRRWYEYTGTTFEQTQGWGWQQVHDPQLLPLVLQRWSVCLASGEPFEMEFLLRGRDGRYRWFLTRGSPLRDANGRIVRWFGTSTDVDAQKRSREESRFLAEASRLLSESTDAPSAIAALTRLAVPTLADWCAVDMVLPEGRFTRAAVAHRDPDKVRLGNELFERFPLHTDDPGDGRAAAVRSGEPVLVPDIPDAMLEQQARDAEHLDLLRRLGLRSALVVPLHVHGRVIGTLSLVHAESGRRFGEENVPLARELAQRAAVLLDRHQTHAALRGSEERFRLLSEAMPQLVWLARPDAHVEYFNRQWYAYTGTTPEQSAGTAWLDVVHPDDAARVAEAWQQANAAARLYEVELRYRRADGEYRWFLARALPELGPDGRPVRWFGTSTDITERKRAEQERQKLVAAVEQSSDFIGIADPQGRALYLNAAGRRMVGMALEVPAEQVNILDFMFEEDRPFVKDTILPTQLKEGRWEGEFRFRHFQTGKAVPVHYNAFALRHPESGALEGFATVTRDITVPKRQQAERERLLAELAQEKARLQAVLEHIPAGVLLAEAPEGRIVLENSQLRRILRHGLSSPSLTRCDEWVGFHPDGRRVERHEWPLARVLSGETIAGEDYLYQRGDGTYGWVRAGGAPIRDAEERLTGGVVALFDADREKRAEARVHLLSEASRMLAEGLEAPEAVLQKVARLASKRVATYCFVDLVEDGAVRRVAVAHREAAGERLLQEESRFPAAPSTCSPLAEALQKGVSLLIEDFNTEVRARCAHSPEHLAVVNALDAHSLLLVPIKARGDVLGLMSLFAVHPQPLLTPEDLALGEELAHRAAAALENTRLYREAQAAVRLRDEFLSVASHELKTPLTPLQLKLQVLKREAQGTQPHHVLRARLAKGLETSEAQVRKLSALVSALLDVSRLSQGRLALQPEEGVDLAGLVREVTASLATQAQAAGCDLQVAANAPVTGRFDRMRLEQVVHNLLSNAIKYGAGRPIRVSVEERGADACLTVEDEGIGIAAEALPRLFGKFERAVSERHYGGLGLGLYITRQIVEAMGGTVRAESVLGQGATFVVRLPLRTDGDSP